MSTAHKEEEKRKRREEVTKCQKYADAYGDVRLEL